MATPSLDSLDTKILRLLSANARIPYLEIARNCNVSGAAIHQRIQRLTNMGVIQGTECLINPAALGYHTCAFISLYLKDPNNYQKAIDGLRQIPEVVECHCTTGPYDLFIKLYAHNNDHLLEIIQNKLQPLGMARTETFISLTNSFTRSAHIDEQ